MLDIRILRETPDRVRERLETRQPGLGTAVDAVLSVDAERRRVETELQALSADRNRLSKEIGRLRKGGAATDALESEVRATGDRIAVLHEQAAAAEQRQTALLLAIPNLPHTAAPVGTDETFNPVIRVWGEPLRHDFPPRDHLELATRLGLVDFERATKLSGSGFLVFQGRGARLQRALIQFLLDLHADSHGYTEISPPLLVRRECMVGTGQLPKMEEDAYATAGDGLFLIPTAEVPVTNLHREEILALADLPKRFVAHTPCFRREAGSAGKETRGMIRVHQFDKVELVKITTPETSFAELESLTTDAERVLQLLGLHYRVIELCTGDLGFASAKTYDIEVWAPGQNRFLEVSSCSNCEDFQARRMNLKYKGADGKNRFCHTLNGSGTALARLYVALLETYQEKDGSVRIPEPLREYVRTDRIGAE